MEDSKHGSCDAHQVEEATDLEDSACNIEVQIEWRI